LPIAHRDTIVPAWGPIRVDQAGRKRIIERMVRSMAEELLSSGKAKTEAAAVAEAKRQLQASGVLRSFDRAVA
jgi:hypothetical protein